MENLSVHPLDREKGKQAICVRSQAPCLLHLPRHPRKGNGLPTVLPGAKPAAPWPRALCLPADLGGPQVSAQTSTAHPPQRWLLLGQQGSFSAVEADMMISPDGGYCYKQCWCWFCSFYPLENMKDSTTVVREKTQSSILVALPIIIEL